MGLSSFRRSRKLFSINTKKNAVRRPSIQLLEDRCVPATVVPGLSFQDARRDYVTPEPSSYLGVVTADVNQDGFVDVAAATDTGGNGFSNRLIVRMGQLNGELGPPRVFDLGGRPVEPVVGDFNEDGRLDLAVTRSLLNDVAVLLGNGDGTFQPLQAFPVQARPEALGVGDFDNDGNLDLTAGNYDSQTISILRGLGDGTFAQAEHHPTAILTGTSFRASPTRVAVNDLNGDTFLDLTFGAIGNYPLSVFINNGDGTFQPARAVEAGASPYSVDAGDLNGDQIPDLAVGSFAFAAQVAVLIGLGDGTFAPPQFIPAGAAEEGLLRDIEIADIDGNGTADLAVASWGLGSVTVLPGNGNGTFQPFRTFPIGGLGNALSTADFNRDGRIDVVAAGGTQLSVLLGDGQGGFRQAPTYAAGPAPNHVVTGDFNRDGRSDIAVTNPAQGTVTVLRNNGNGTFAPPDTYVVGGTITSLAVGDFNNDRIPDLAASVTSGGNNISILRGVGNGTFLAPQAFAVPGPYSLTLGDFNNDGNLDAVVLSNAFPYDYFLLPGNGDGTLQPPQVIGEGTYMSLAAGDFDGDGNLDIVTAFRLSPSSNYRTQVTVRLGNGDGTFVSHDSKILVNTRDTSRLHVADVNRDGLSDVLVSNSYRSTIYTLLANPNGTLRFAEEGGFDGVFFQGGLDVDSVAVADFDGDGIVDLAAAGGRSNFYVRPGNGDGTFRSGANFGVDVRPTELAIGDFNGDGIVDAVTANESANNVSILINTRRRKRGPVSGAIA